MERRRWWERRADGRQFCTGRTLRHVGGWAVSAVLSVGCVWSVGGVDRGFAQDAAAPPPPAATSGAPGESSAPVRPIAPQVDFVMNVDPELTLPKAYAVFSDELRPLWLAALARRDAETRRLAAGTIELARRRGMQGLEAAIEPLRETLKTDADPVVRRAAASSLAALDARAAADDLAEAARQDGLLTAQVVEPALARWDHRPSRERWLERLGDSRATVGGLLLAYEGLSRTRDERAVEPLTKTVRDRRTPATLRLAAARALAEIRDSGLAPTAVELAGEPGKAETFERLLAAVLLRRQSDEAAVELLRRLAADSDPSVAATALQRLGETSVESARPMARDALRSLDATLRSVALPIVAGANDEQAVRSLAPLLDDRNPSVRRAVAAQFVEFAARPELKPVVLETASTTLAQDGWRGLEQAALVLGALDHEPAAPRLLELLRHARGETAVAAAWALRKLQVGQTLGAALAHADAVHQSIGTEQQPLHATRQLTQLFQMFGELRYVEANGLMRKYVPKGRTDPVMRGAACWALGCIYENQPDNDLVGPFAERLADVLSLDPEAPEVRRMTAVGLGRMKARSQTELVRKFAESETGYSISGLACQWALEQLTGEKSPPAPDRQVGVAGWFLEPIPK